MCSHTVLCGAFYIAACVNVSERYFGTVHRKAHNNTWNASEFLRITDKNFNLQSTYFYYDTVLFQLTTRTVLSGCVSETAEVQFEFIT